MKTNFYSALQNRAAGICALILFTVGFANSANAQCIFDPVFDLNTPCGTVVNAIAGVPLQISIHTSDPDGHDPHMTLTSGALPAGATTSPPLPETDNPPSAVFIWTPTAAQTGQHIVTFTVTDDCNAQATCTFTIDVAPPQCTFTQYAFASGLNTCDDNGTPNDPSDDFFLKTLNVLFFNRPATGDLQIAQGGDAIGTYSVPVSNLINNSHFFHNVKFKADGTATEVQVNFTDEPTCVLNATGPTVQPCSAAPPACTVSAQPSGSPSACNDNGTPNDPADDYFIQDVFVTYSNAPGTGDLQLQPGTHKIAVANIAVPGQHTFTGCHFPANGTPVDVNISFTSQPACEFDFQLPAVQSCSVPPPPCTISAQPSGSPSACNDNGTPNDPADDYFIQDVFVTYSNGPGTGDLQLQPGTHKIPVSNIAVPGQHTFTGCHFPANGTPVNVNIIFTSELSCEFNFQLPGVQSCSTPAIINLTCPAPVTVTCAGNVPLSNPAAVNETHTCAGIVTILHVGDAISSQACANRYTITRTYVATDQCGQTASCQQVITVDDHTAPVFNCPSSQLLACGVALNFVTPSAADCESAAAVTEVSTTSAVNSNGSKAYTRTWQAVDICGNTSTCSQTITVPICEEHCTNGQGYYGNQNGLSCAGLTANQSITNALSGSSIVLGCSNKLVTINTGEAACVVQKMPGGSTPSALPNASVNCGTATGNNYLKNGRFKNSLFAQTLALSLNLRLDNTLGAMQIANNYFSTYAATSCTNGSSVAGTRQVFYVPQSVRNCIGNNGTVNNLLALANKMLGGNNGACATGCNASLGDVTQALDAINSAFNNCRILGYWSNTAAGARIENENTDAYENGIELSVYPNPASGSTTISFFTEQTQKISIRVFDMDGRIVSTLADKIFEKGENELLWNAQNVEQGIYFIQYLSAENSEMVKLVMTK